MNPPLSPWGSYSVSSSRPFNLPTETVPPPTPIQCPCCRKYWALSSFVSKAPALTFRGILFTYSACSPVTWSAVPSTWPCLLHFFQKFLQKPSLLMAASSVCQSCSRFFLTLVLLGGRIHNLLSWNCTMQVWKECGPQREPGGGDWLGE